MNERFHMRRVVFNRGLVLPVLKLCWGFAGALLFSIPLHAQWNKGLAVESNLLIGKIIKHNPLIQFDAPALSQGFELGLSWQTTGKREWQQWRKYPRVGFALHYFNFGDREVLGRAYGFRYDIIMANIQQKRLKFEFRFGTGFTWLDRPYNRFTNPINNAIGSTFNVMAQLMATGSYRLTPRWYLSGGIGLTHYSNGAMQLPNLGINIASASFGIRFIPKPIEPESFVYNGLSKAATDKWGIQLEAGIAHREIRIAGGPRYPIKSYSIAGLYHLNRINRVSMGLTYEYNRAIYAFGQNVFAFNSEREAFWGASRISIFAADELMFGNFGLGLQTGFYVGDFSYLLPEFFYIKVIHRYYIDLLARPKTRLFVGITLKTHLSVAEYFSLNAGLEF